MAPGPGGLGNLETRGAIFKKKFAQWHVTMHIAVIMSDCTWHTEEIGHIKFSCCSLPPKECSRILPGAAV